MIDLVQASMVPLLPISQAADTTVAVKPLITVITENEFLLLSWTGASTIGVFITGDGDPVRGTLEWPSHPEAICKFLCSLLIDVACCTLRAHPPLSVSRNIYLFRPITAISVAGI